jgi:hypothetical protein
MIRNVSKIISVGMNEEDLKILEIPMMSPVMKIGDILAIV